MRRIGLTGGIGMGKSACAEFLRRSGVQVVDTDDLARELVEPGHLALGEIAKVFGASVIKADGTLCRDSLARLIFNKQAARHQLELILHPKVLLSWRAKLEQWEAAGVPLAVVVIPLLFETNAAHYFDAVVCVACTKSTQRSRVNQRGWSIEQLQSREAAQLPVDQKLDLSSHVIWTEGSMAVHREQIRRILGV